MKRKTFPSGFSFWRDTFYEMVQAITIEWLKDKPVKIIAETHDAQGHCGLYDLAEQLTDKFEKQNKDREWNGQFFDEIDAFLKIELKN